MSMVTKFLGFTQKQSDDDQENGENILVDNGLEDDDQGVGKIKKSFFYYITWPMIGLIVAVLLLVLSNIDNLATNFKTNVALNGAIIGMAVYAIIKAFLVNYTLFKTSKFLRKIDELTEAYEITEMDAEDLRHDLQKGGRLLNTSNMAKIVENVIQYGHPNFTDMDARLIKSKFGYRVSSLRAGVGFIAGILVMMGLLGTFLGLLKTIDAVEQVLGSMSSFGGGDSSATESGMGSFISGLSAPLQGMGLAFSSSLFGLSGSLLIGYFNNMCGNVQSRFIEDVSRWIDERIPKLDPKIKKAAQSKKMPEATDLQSWLAGFVYLSSKTHKKMSQLFLALSKTADHSISMSRNTEKLCQQGELMTSLIADMKSSIDHMAKNVSSQTQVIEPLSAAMLSVKSDVSVIGQDMKKQLDLGRVVLDDIKAMKAISSRVEDGVVEVASHMQKMSAEMSVSTSGIADTLNNLQAEVRAFEVLKPGVSSLQAGIDRIGAQNETLIALSERSAGNFDGMAKTLEKQQGQILQSTKVLEVSLSSADKLSQSLSSQIVPLRETLEGTSISMENISKEMTGQVGVLQDTLGQQIQYLSDVTDRITEPLNAFTASLQSMHESHQRLFEEIKAMKTVDEDGLPVNHDEMARISNLTWQLNVMIEELKEKQDSYIFENLPNREENTSDRED